MKKALIILAAFAFVCIGFLSFKSITQTRVKDTCIVFTEFGITDYNFSIIYPDGKQENLKGKHKAYKEGLVNLFSSMNDAGWELKGTETFTRIYNGNASGPQSNFIFERNHQ